MVLSSAGAPKNPRKKCSPGNPAPKSIRESEVRLLWRGFIPLDHLENPQKILGTRLSTIFKKFRVKTALKLKINQIQNTFNFVSVQ
jgi:hypothetical protein